MGRNTVAVEALARLDVTEKVSALSPNLRLLGARLPILSWKDWPFGVM